MSKEKCKNGCDMLPIEGGYCLYCIRRELNKPEKLKEEKNKKFNIQGFKTQPELFKYVWKNNSHICFVSGQNLGKYYGTKFFANLFAHIIPKGSFKEFKLYSNNIVLLSPDYEGYNIHGLFDNPTLDKILEFENKTGKTFQPLFELEILIYNEYKREVGTTKPLRKIIKKYLDAKNNIR